MVIVEQRNIVSMEACYTKVRNSRQGFYHYLKEQATKNEAVAYSFCVQNGLIPREVTCKFCKVCNLYTVYCIFYNVHCIIIRVVEVFGHSKIATIIL